MHRDHMTGRAKSAINRFYEHADTRNLNQLQELASELYLTAKGSPAADKLWTKAAAVLDRLKVPAATSSPALTSKDPAKLAALVQSLLK